MTFYQLVERFQGDIIRKALDDHAGNNTKAAQELGLHRNTFLRYRHKFDIAVNEPNCKKSIVRRNESV